MKRKIISSIVCLIALCWHSSSAQAQSGVYVGTGSSVSNSIIYGNTDNGNTANQLSSVGTVSNTAVQGATAPTGMANMALATSPFVGDATTQEKYSAKQGATTINAGDYAKVETGHIVDAAGYNRVWNTTVDMGAYEYQFPRTITITTQNASKYFGQVDPKLTYIITGDNLLPTDSISVQLRRATGTAVGNYNIDTASVSIYRLGSAIVTSQYTISVVKGQLAINPLRNITIAAQSASKYVGESDPVFTYTLSGDGVAADDSLNVQLKRAVGETAGSYDIDTASVLIFKKVGGADVRYQYNITFAKTQLTIHALRNITITIADAEKVEGGEDPTFTYELSGDNVVVGDSISVQLTRATGEEVGTYDIDTTSVRIFKKAGGQNMKHHYAITVVKGTFTVTKAPVTAVTKNILRANVHPTITTGTLYISSEEQVGQVKVEVYGLNGSLLKSQTYNSGTFDIDLSAVPSGMLFIKLSSGDKSATIQVVKR